MCNTKSELLQERKQTLKFVPSSTLMLGKHGYWTKKQPPGGVIDENIDRLDEYQQS